LPTHCRECLPDKDDDAGHDELAAIADDEQMNALKMVASPATIEMIKSAAAADNQYQLLLRQIHVGWHDAAVISPAVKDYVTFADKLTEVGGLVFKGDRVVIPQDARAEISRCIHSSHIGVNGCIRRAREAVFYPGMTADMKLMVSRCAICAEHQAMSHKEPLMPYTAPSRPRNCPLLMRIATRLNSAP